MLSVPYGFLPQQESQFCAEMADFCTGDSSEWGDINQKLIKPIAALMSRWLAGTARTLKPQPYPYQQT